MIYFVITIALFFHTIIFLIEWLFCLASLLWGTPFLIWIICSVLGSEESFFNFFNRQLAFVSMFCCFVKKFVSILRKANHFLMLVALVIACCFQKQITYVHINFRSWKTCGGIILETGTLAKEYLFVPRKSCYLFIRDCIRMAVFLLRHKFWMKSYIW